MPEKKLLCMSFEHEQICKKNKYKRADNDVTNYKNTIKNNNKLVI